MVKVYEIIKKNEEFICRMNYLTYPTELGIFKGIKYKFSRNNFLKPYSKFFKMIDDFVYRSVYNGQEDQGREIDNLLKFRTLMLLYFEILKNGILTFKEVYALKAEKDGEFKNEQGFIKKEMDEIEKQLGIIEKTPSAWSSIKIQKLYFEELKNLLHIIKKENLKEKVIRNDSEKLNNLLREIEFCKERDKKYKLLQKVYEVTERNGKVEFYEKGIKILKKVQEDEENRKIIFEVEEKIIEYTKEEFWLCIKEMLNKIEKDQLNKEKLVEYLNKELNEHKYSFLVDEVGYDHIKELNKKGIVEVDGIWVIKPGEI